MTRSQFLIPLVCLFVIGGVALNWHPSPAPTEPTFVTEPATVPEEPQGEPEPILQARKPPTDTSIDAPVFAEVQPGDDRPEAPALPEAIAETADASIPTVSSWENPFTAELWRTEGWKVGARGLETDGSASSSATFVRPYRKFMVECDVLGTGASDASWELRLTTRNAASMSFILRPDRITVQAVEHGTSRTILEKSVTTQLLRGIPRQFRIVATGNRIMVSWDKRKLLTTEQIRSQSGHDITWSIHTVGAEFHIPRMRVEGE